MIVVWVLLGWFVAAGAFVAGWLACSWFIAGKQEDTRLMK
jgi:hypothetical protein